MLTYTVRLTILATFTRTVLRTEDARVVRSFHHLPPEIFHPLTWRSVLLDSLCPHPCPGTHHSTSFPCGSAGPGHRAHRQEGSCNVHPFASGRCHSPASQYRSICALGERTGAPCE